MITSLDNFTGFTQMKLNITAPKPFDIELEYKNLTLMCGMNDTGKSFCNKLMWVSTFFFNLKLVEYSTGVKDESKTDEEMFQFMLDRTFDDQDINGEVVFHSRDDLLQVSFFSIKYTVDNGKVISVDCHYPEHAKPSGAPTYLSKESRDFGAIGRYMKVKKMMGITDITSMEDIEKLTEFHKLYDVFAFEGMIQKLENINPILDVMKSVGGELIEELGLQSIEFDKTNGTMNYYDLKNEKHSLTSLGSGSQSMLIMIMSAV